MEPGLTKVVSFAVADRVTVELVLASFWSTAGESSVEVEVYFRGVSPVPPVVSLTGGQRVSGIVRVWAHLGHADIAPSAKLDKWRQTVRPSNMGKITPLGGRDVMLDGSASYQMLLEYEFDNGESTGSTEVTPRWPALQVTCRCTLPLITILFLV